MTFTRHWILPFLAMAVYAQAQDAPAADTPVSGAAAAPSEAPSVPTAPAENAPVTVNTGFGEESVKITPGEGRFAQPPLRFTFLINNGYDDNLFSAPNKAQPGLPKAERASTFITGANLETAVQMVSPRDALVVDAGIGSLYYWNKPAPDSTSGPKTHDYNGSLAVIFSHQVAPRMRFSTSLNVVYQSDPDVSRRYTPTRGNTGPYYNGGSRLQIDYRWSPRISSSHFYSAAGTYYEKASAQSDNVLTHTVGSSLNYLFSPKSTIVGEYRFETETRQNKSLESHSQFLLVGGNYAFSPRFSLDLRVGEQFRTYAQSSQTKAAPHVEGSLSYAYAMDSRISWTNWYGLETASGAGGDQSTYRTGIHVSHVLTSRITALAGLDLSHRGGSTGTPGSTGSSEDDFTLSLSLQYVVTSSLKLGLTYTRTQLLSNDPFQEYSRDRFLMDAGYAF